MKTIFGFKIFILSALTLSACKVRAFNEATAADAHVFLSASDMQPGKTLTTLSDDDLKARISNDSLFKARSLTLPGPTLFGGANDSDPDCDAVLKPMTVHASRGLITVWFSGDFVRCVYPAGVPQRDKNSADFKLFFEEKCDGIDFSPLDSKGTQALVALGTAAYDCGKSRGAISIQYNMQIHVVDNLAAGGAQEAYTRMTMQNALGLPCQMSANDTTVTIADSCILTSRQFGSSMAAESFERFETSGLTQKNDASSLWYSGGKVLFQTQGWNGTVTYTQSDVAPTYDMSLAADHKTGPFDVPTPSK